MPQAVSGRCGGKTDAEEPVPAMFYGARKETVMDYYMAEIELIEWHRKNRERSARASMFAQAQREDTEAETQHRSQALAPEVSQCRCWHCSAALRTV